MAFYAGSSSYGLNDGMSYESWQAIQEESERKCSRSNEYSEPPFPNSRYYKITDDMLKVENIDNFNLPFGDELNKVERKILEDLAKTMRSEYKTDRDNSRRIITTKYKIDSEDLKFRRKKVQRFLVRNNDFLTIKVYKDKEKNLILFAVDFKCDLDAVENHRHYYFRDWDDKVEERFKRVYGGKTYKRIPGFYL